MTPEGDDDGIVRRPPHLSAQFDRIGSAYDARPGYPARVWELLAQRCGLGSGTEVLEIGPGTGQATLPMLAAGARVTAVEPGATLAQRLRDRAAGKRLDIVGSTFESAELPDAAFDLVASATAFHWVDLDVAVPKIAAVLRDGGWVALWWTIWGDPDRPDPLHEAMQPVLREKAPHLLADDAGARRYAADIAARAHAFERSPWFTPLEHEHLRWTGRHDPEQVRRIFATFAGWIALPEPRRSELLDDLARVVRDELGGAVERPYQTVVYLTARRGR